ncbi:MAG TPA: hypothetical protein VLQ68_11760 [Rhizobiaceae bacterium]|nr:hypothetical protein [Rhizobiaceae bacterium]
MVSRAISLFGTEQEDPPMRRLEAGPLTVDFDNGALRYVKVGGIEVIRAIAFLVRDENWGTFSPELSDLSIDQRSDGFRIDYAATCSDAARTLTYTARVEGRADGLLSFEVKADPQTDVQTNRTGFIVLHPVDGVAGRPVKVERVDGGSEMSIFPDAVDPKCPFTDIRALTHEFAPGAWVTCTMEGDAFEMEDQRNWSDASYKTYVRPLRRPWPYTLMRGEKLRQSVSLRVSGAAPATASSSAGAAAKIGIGAVTGKMPLIGVAASADRAADALAAGDLLSRLSPRLLVCQVDLRSGEGLGQMDHYRRMGEITGAPVTLEIITKGSLDPESELLRVAEAARSSGLEPEAVEVFRAQEMVSVQPGAPWPEMPSFEESYAAARKVFPGVRVGGGMATYFTELNRKRPPAAPLDYVTFTTCPTVHAADDVSVMETNEAIAHLVRSTRSFMGEDLPIRIGPSQIGCRENPYGKSTAPNRGNGRVCLSRIDPRQRGLYNAAWLLAYVAACARSGVEAVALGEPTGPFGYIHQKADFQQPWYDQVTPPAVYPAFHVFRDLARLSGQPLLAADTGNSALEAVAAKDGGRSILWIANKGSEPAVIDTSWADGGRAAVLDASVFESMATDPAYLENAERDLQKGPVKLDAYGLVRIAW